MIPPLLVTTCALNMAGAPLRSAVSRTGRRLTCISVNVRTALEDNASFNLQREALLERLIGLRKEHANPDWDGYGALPIDNESYQFARLLVEKYPADLLLPEFAVDPDGEVSLEWNNSNKSVFALSISAVGRLSYAGLFGEELAKGTVYFTNEFPPEIIDFVQRIALEA